MAEGAGGQQEGGCREGQEAGETVRSNAETADYISGGVCLHGGLVARKVQGTARERGEMGIA